MFSGIVQEAGKVMKFVKEKDIYNLSIDCSSDLLSNLKKGASVSVNGVCLTVKDLNPEMLRFDLVEETIKRTNFQIIKAGDNVNLERSLKIGDEIGGHLVSGHIHGTSKVILVGLDRQEKGSSEISAKAELENDFGLTVSSIVNLDLLISFVSDDPNFKEFKNDLEEYRSNWGA